MIPRDGQHYRPTDLRPRPSYAMMLNSCLASMYICIGTFDGLVTFVGRFELRTCDLFTALLTRPRHLGIFLLLTCRLGPLQNSERDVLKTTLQDVDDKSLHIRFSKWATGFKRRHQRSPPGRGDWAADCHWVGSISHAIFSQRLEGHEGGCASSTSTLCDCKTELCKHHILANSGIDYEAQRES